MSIIHIIAHKDFDGVVSSLCFALSDFADVGKVTFVEVYNITNYLLDNKNELKDQRLWFVDLAISMGDLEIIKELTLDYLVLDHHETTKELLGNAHVHFRDTWLKEPLNTILSPREMELLDYWEPISCAVLCHHYSTFRGQHGHVTGNLDKLVQHSRIVDTGLYSKINNKDSLKFAKLCDKYGADVYYDLLLDRLINLKPLTTPDEEAYVFGLMVEYEKETRRVKEDGVSVNIKGLNVLIFESDGELSEIAEDLAQDFKLCVGINRKTGRVILRTRNKNYGLGGIARDLFNGGGHSTAAGFRYSELEALTVAQLVGIVMEGV